MAIIYKVMAHFDENGEQLVKRLNDARKDSHFRSKFLFEGKPYAYCDVKEEDSTVVFRWDVVRSAKQPLFKAFYGVDQLRAFSRRINIVDIIGYDIVDVWDGKKYLDTVESITTK